MLCSALILAASPVAAVSDLVLPASVQRPATHHRSFSSAMCLQAHSSNDCCARSSLGPLCEASDDLCRIESLCERRSRPKLLVAPPAAACCWCPQRPSAARLDELRSLQRPQPRRPIQPAAEIRMGCRGPTFMALATQPFTAGLLRGLLRVTRCTPCNRLGLSGCPSGSNNCSSLSLSTSAPRPRDAQPRSTSFCWAI